MTTLEYNCQPSHQVVEDPKAVVLVLESLDGNSLVWLLSVYWVQEKEMSFVRRGWGIRLGSGGV